MINFDEMNFKEITEFKVKELFKIYDDMYAKNSFINSCIYRLEVGDEIYIGSTKNYHERMCAHRLAINDETLTRKVYKAIRNNNNKYVMIKMWNFPCNNENELWNEEQNAIDNYQPTLNSINAYGINKEKLKQRHRIYKKINREKLTQQQKIWCENNKEKVKKQKKDYKEKNKIKVKQQSKEYFINNKEKINQQNMDYYEQNKEKLNQQRREEYRKNSEKIKCDCDCIISKNTLRKHIKTKKHLQIMEQKKLLQENTIIS
mgnify:FL=1